MPIWIQFPTYDNSFVAKPHYNPYKTLVIYAFMFFKTVGWMDT